MKYIISEQQNGLIKDSGLRAQKKLLERLTKQWLEDNYPELDKQRWFFVEQYKDNTFSHYEILLLVTVDYDDWSSKPPNEKQAIQSKLTDDAEILFNSVGLDKNVLYFGVRIVPKVGKK